jgi:DNA replication licensing factor MCM7
MPKYALQYRFISAGFVAEIYLECHCIAAVEQNATPVTRPLVEAAPAASYERMAQSIAPQIHGLVDVKKAILLMMVGGSSINRANGINVRGAINICLMGDPGVAKSQLLKWVTRIAPRAVYTTGKGSSGVGLTAAVVQDPVTGANVLEAGAIVLADNVCQVFSFRNDVCREYAALMNSTRCTTRTALPCMKLWNSIL